MRSGGRFFELVTALAAVTALAVLVGACTVGDPEPTVVAGQSGVDATVAPAEPAPVASAPPVEPSPVETPSRGERVATEPAANEVVPSCDAVPVFFSADTVSIACVDEFAVSPELFANNAGWHLFEAVNGEWIEIDYAMTCCGQDEVPFAELLSRSGVGADEISELCAASGLGSDPSSGCTPTSPVELPADFEPTWLRVNGLSDHDFGATDTAVLASLDAVFGPALDSSEVSECGAGPMTIVSFDDFAVNFQDGEFIGWFYRSSDPALTTPSGVAPGIDEPSLIEVYDGVEIFEESLGKEFFFEVSAGYMGGFFADDSATVTAMFAGINCFFR